MNTKGLFMTDTTTYIAGTGKDSVIQLVNFTVDNEEYGVEVLKVREIIRMTDVTRVPNAPNFVDGVFNLRGKVIPIISLRKRLSLPVVDSDNKTRIIVLDIDNMLTGILVDSVTEVLRISIDEIQMAPAALTSSIEPDLFVGLVNRDNRIFILLNFNNMLTRDDI
jgi:purine-binding chemotaxis protein CheW